MFVHLRLLLLRRVNLRIARSSATAPLTTKSAAIFVHERGTPLGAAAEIISMPMPVSITKLETISPRRKFAK